MEAPSTAGARQNCQLATQMCHVTFSSSSSADCHYPRKRLGPRHDIWNSAMLPWLHSGMFYRQLISWCVPSLTHRKFIAAYFHHHRYSQQPQTLGWKNWWNLYTFYPSTCKLSNRTHRGPAAENSTELEWKGLMQSIEMFILWSTIISVGLDRKVAPS